MKVIIDRFEGDFAIVELEDKSTIGMPLKLVPEGGKEGDVLKITIDVEETKARRDRIEKLMDDLWS